MAHCPQCGAAVPPGARFCPSCGTVLAAGCSSCGADLVPGARFCPSCGAPQQTATAPAQPATPVAHAPPPAAVPAAAAAPVQTEQDFTVESRRTVTMLFSDVTGSTAMGEKLDPESTRRVMSRYFDRLRDVIDQHGGTVEKFIGDAVVAAFGIPTLHEDDALRAVRAAADMRAALAELNEEFSTEWGVTIDARTGVYTGEVVVGDVSSGSTFATGDTVNTAARLEQAAPPGEVLIGESTLRLVKDAVTVEPVEPLALKGKADPVAAYRLVSVDADAPGVRRQLSSPIVGRERELAELEAAFQGVASSGSCALVTLYAPAGTGKSRLTLEFVESVRSRSTVLQGRCVPYGRGITYFPLRLVVNDLARIEESDSREHALAKLDAVIPEGEDGVVVGRRLAGAIGLAEDTSRPEEIAWAFRRLLVRHAAERPLVVVFDDIHWAEPTFLDLIEYLAQFTREAPVLLLCPARPDLRELRPEFGLSSPDSRAITLQPLGPDDCARLIDNLLGTDGVAQSFRDRVIEAAEGNPLFVEEMLRMLVDDGHLQRENGGWKFAAEADAIEIPPSIEALLATRIDRLQPLEKAVLQRASVIGRVFGWDAVAHLTPAVEQARVGASLQTLTRRELIRPDPTGLAGEDAYRFGHILIRDAAYRSVAKETRADLHERFAVWLEERTGERAGEMEEIIGFHLEQAVRFRRELGPLGADGLALAARAATRLALAGRRAFHRGDLRASADLLRRAVDLRAADDAARIDEQRLLGRVLARLGQFDEAKSVLKGAEEEAVKLQNAVYAARVRIEIEVLHLYTGEVTRVEESIRVLDEAMPLLDRERDDLGLARALFLQSEVDRITGHYDEHTAHLERARVHARAARLDREEVDLMLQLGASLCYGPTPVEKAIERCGEMLESHRGEPWVEAMVSAMLAYLEARRQRFDESRAYYARTRAILEELGMTFSLASRVLIPASTELLAGELDAAERELRWGYDVLLEAGEQELRSTIAATLAQVLVAAGRLDEAAQFTDVSEEAAADDDVSSQATWRGARAKVLARRDGDPRAEGLARDAVELAAPTDDLTLRGDTLADLAEVLAVLGRADEARTVLDEATALYEQKGDLASKARAQATLLGLAGGP